MDETIIHVNKKSYDEVIRQLGWIPSNLKVSNFVEDGMALVIDGNAVVKEMGRLRESEFIAG